MKDFWVGFKQGFMDICGFRWLKRLMPKLTIGQEYEREIDKLCKNLRKLYKL